MVIQIGIAGIDGRMGRMIRELVAAEPQMQLTGGVEPAGSAAVGRSVACGEQTVSVSETIDFPLDVLIDFSSPEGTARNLALAAEKKFAMVIGTTGLTAEHDAAIEKAAAGAAILAAPNMSVGMNLLFDLVRSAAARLGPEFDVEIIETHHKHKKDAPSGSALALLESVRQGRTVASVGYGREGQVGERVDGEVHLHAIRGGDVVGDHQVILAGPGERIELAHRAGSRECFARGAVAAARFVATAVPGRYGMGDVLEGLRSDNRNT